MSDDDQLSHFNQRGEARMVDVGDKTVTQRTAVAEGYIQMQADTMQRILQKIGRASCRERV